MLVLGLLQSISSPSTAPGSRLEALEHGLPRLFSQAAVELALLAGSEAGLTLASRDEAERILNDSGS